jgi:hypothetical protein
MAGFAQTRWDQDQSEESVSVMEVGEFEFTETKTAQKAGKLDSRNLAESRRRESGMDL